MSFIKYIENKRFFFIIYSIIMLFVSLMMIVSTNGNNLVSNILYTHLGCAILGTIYIIIGYFYHNTFYHQLNEITKSHKEELLAAIPKSQNHEQELYILLLKKLQNNYLYELQALHNEKKDYQDFIMSWVHEVKLPITASHLLMKNSTGKTVDYIVDKFEDEVNKIDNYVEQALYYSRIDSFSKDYFITDISLNQIIRECAKKYSKIFINKHIRLTMLNSEQFVHSDSKWLGFVIDQIVANSLKYTDNSGIISFSFDESNNEKLLHIRDTGIGIKPEDISRVFEKGFTGSIGRNHSKSTGMGLYLAKQMALKLGHDISIESVEGKQTNVTIHFPKHTNYYHL